MNDKLNNDFAIFIQIVEKSQAQKELTWEKGSNLFLWDGMNLKLLSQTALFLPGTQGLQDQRYIQGIENDIFFISTKLLNRIK